jgi:hypothetical protein
VLGPPRSAATLAGPVDLPAPEEQPQVAELRVEQAEPGPEPVQEVWPPAERPAFPGGQPARTRARKPVFIVHDDEQPISEKPAAVPSEVESPKEPAADVEVGTPKRLLVIHEESDKPKQDGTSLDTIVLDESQIKATGATFSGTVLEIRPPGIDATFHVGANIPIRARLLVLNELPVALPPGMAAFSAFVAPQWKPGDIVPDVGIVWRLPADAPGAKHIDRLALYAYDVKEGWGRIPGQKVAVDEGRFSAVGTLAYAYAVFGPAELKDTD